MYRLVIFLDDLEADALRSFAKKEYRDVRSQAAIILREELIRHQLLPSVTDQIQYSKPECQASDRSNNSYTEEDDEPNYKKP